MIYCRIYYSYIYNTHKLGKPWIQQIHMMWKCARSDFKTHLYAFIIRLYALRTESIAAKKQQKPEDRLKGRERVRNRKWELQTAFASFF